MVMKTNKKDTMSMKKCYLTNKERYEITKAES